MSWEIVGSVSMWAIIIWAWLCSLFFTIFGTNALSRVIGIIALIITIAGTIHYAGLMG